MKTYKNSINGKDYLYAYDKIFIAKGKSIAKRKSLGRVDSLTDIPLKKQIFLAFLMAEETKKRVEYWGKKINDKKFLKYVSMEKIEKARTALYRAKENMGPMGTSAMETAFLVDFIYNSNKMEGSKIPRENVEKEVQEGSKKNDEIGNTLKAVYYVDNKFRFNIKQIKKLHSILLAHEPGKLGLRKKKIIVGNSEVDDWEDIKTNIKRLIEWLKIADKTWYPPELAFTFYYRFERIHPFVDGNGRTGRLIMNKILKNHHYHPIIIWDKRRQAHLTAFENYIRGGSEKYFKFMVDQFVKSHEIYIEKIQKAFDFDKLGEYFLTPSKYTIS